MPSPRTVRARLKSKSAFAPASNHPSTRLPHRPAFCAASAKQPLPISFYPGRLRTGQNSDTKPKNTSLQSRWACPRASVADLWLVPSSLPWSLRVQLLASAQLDASQKHEELQRLSRDGYFPPAAAEGARIVMRFDCTGTTKANAWRNGHAATRI